MHTIRVEQLEPGDVLDDATKILGRPERYEDRVLVITEKGVKDWPCGEVVTVQKWHEKT